MAANPSPQWHCALDARLLPVVQQPLSPKAENEAPRLTLGQNHIIGPHQSANEALAIALGIFSGRLFRFKKQRDQKQKEALKTMPQPHVPELLETEFLSTPGLICEYFFNILSWLRATKMIAVAVDSCIYWWNGDSVISRITPHGLNESIVCIECSQQDLIAACTSSGGFFVISQHTGCVKSINRFSEAICCVRWFPNGRFVIIGGHNGHLYLAGVEDGVLTILSVFGAQGGRICGMFLVC